MKTPAHPFTIHVIEAKYVVTHLAVPRPSIWVRARPYLAHGLARARRGLVQSGHVTRVRDRCVVPPDRPCRPRRGEGYSLDPLRVDQVT